MGNYCLIIHHQLVSEISHLFTSQLLHIYVLAGDESGTAVQAFSVTKDVKVFNNG